MMNGILSGKQRRAFLLCIAATMMMTVVGLGALAGTVPAEYTRLAYIDAANGDCWIDTGYAPTEGHRLDYDMMPLSEPSVSCRYLGCSGLVGVGRHQNGYWQLGKDMNNYSGGTANKGTRYLVSIYIPGYSSDYTSGAYFVNDALCQNNYALAGSMTLAVFGRKTTTTCECSPVRVYSLTIRNSSNEIVHEYLPVRQISGGALGLCDTVSGDFLTNDGTGTFTAGPDFVASSIKIGTTAYDSIEAAYAAASETEETVVELASGSDPIRLTCDRLTIAKPVVLRGTGATPDDTIVKPARRSADAFLFYMNHAGARFENLTLADGRNARENNEESGESPIVVENGTISNCVIRSFSGSGRYGAVRMTGGVLQDSLIRDNMLWVGANGSVGFGGGICLYGGAPLVTNCVITRCRAGHSGGGVYMAANNGRMIGCAITNNVTASYYGTGLFISVGTVEDCIISGNGLAGTAGSGVCIMKAYRGDTGWPILRRCLIADNAGVNANVGVYMERGHLDHCSIVNNESSSSTPGGIYQSDGTIVSCLFALNKGTGATASLKTFSRTGGTLTNCVSDAEIPAGGTVKDNTVGAINFTDPAAKDYHLAPGCVATHAGCYPYAPGKLACAAVYDLEMHDGVEPIQFTAVVDGSDQDGLTYAWDFNGDGVVDSTEANPKWTNPPYGTYRVKLTVKNAVGDESVSYVQKAVEIVPSTVYVSQEGSGTYPYDTWAKATNDVEVALAAVCATESRPGTINVATGTYQVASFWIELTKPIRIIGTGPTGTVFKAYNGGKEYRRVIYVNHEKALVSGVNLTNGRLYNGGEGGYTDDTAGPAGLRLISGVVTNCWISDCKGSDNCGGVDMQGGTLVDSQVFRCWAGRHNNGSIGRGGGIRLRGGLVENCVISNCSANGATTAETAAGGGVYMTGGILRGSKILKNNAGGYGDATNYRRGAGLVLGAGLVDRCEISGNYNCTYGAGVFMGKTSTTTGYKESSAGTGILRNCFIHDNTAQCEGAGVYINDGSGTIEHCTIVANTSKDSQSGGLYQNAGTVRNSIIYNNGDPASAPNCNVKFAKGTSFDYNISAPTVSGTNIGTHNLTDAPGFANAAQGDYTLGTGSIAIDSALPIEAVTNDFLGAIRPKKGSETSAEAISDRGCYEAKGVDEGDFRCSISYTTPISGFPGMTVTYTANVAGLGSKGKVAYVWNYGDGVKTSESESGDSITVRYDTYGKHSISLKATNSSKTEVSASFTDLVTVGAQKVYIDKNGKSVWPYDTWANAATNVMEAFNTIVLSDGNQSEVVVSNGTYEIDELWVKITAPIYFHSVNGPEATILMARNLTYDPSKNNNWQYKRILMLNNADAVCEGFTMTGGSCYNYTSDGAGPGALRLFAGTVRNCVIRDNLGADNAGGVDMRGGTLENCRIFRNNAWRDNNGDVGNGAGVRISAGNSHILNCAISNNTARVSGGGIYVDTGLTGVVVSNCVIAGNVNGTWWSNGANYTGRNGAGIYALSGLFTHNVITGNYSQAYRNSSGTKMTGEAAVHLGGTAELRNSLVARNLSAWGAQGVVMESAKAKVVNCTITANGQDGYEYKESYALSSKFTKGTLSNTIVWGDEGDLKLSLADAVVQSHNWTEGDPQFKKAEKGNWRLKNYSPCVNAGDNAAAGSDLESAVDLDGQPRLRHKTIDIGCYERLWSGMSIIVR